MKNTVKNTTFVSLLDLLAPHSCRGCGRIGTILCNRCKKYILSQKCHICPICKTPTINNACKNCTDLPAAYIIGERSGLLGDLVHGYKYNSIRALAHPLAEMLASTLPVLKNAVLVPLPTATHHIRARGFDHTLLLAKSLSKITGYETRPLLVCAKNTVQVGTNLETRKLQATNAYTVAATNLDSRPTYVLIDDVWTTGASMLSAVKKLRQAGAKSIIIALLSISKID